MALAQDGSQIQSIHNMDPKLQRPATGLARGVQITEYKETKINPNPLLLEESDLLMEQYLSPNKLSTDHDSRTENLTERLITGVDNLEDVESLELKVNTEDTSLGNFGSLLPNLRQIKLSDSVIPRVRDLGSSLRSVQVMWMSRCGLNELDGISSMSSLKEVYLSYNDITDISPMSMLDTLQILDLEGNNIEDIAQVQYLSLCQNLKSLALEGNPVCVMSSPDSQEVNYNYREAVKKILPHLRILDDEALIEGQASKMKPNAFEDDWAYLQELQKDALMMEETLESLDNIEPEMSAPVTASGVRPGTAALRPATSYRPGSSLRPGSAFRAMTSARRPATIAATRPMTSARPTTPNRPVSSDSVEVDPSSDLTAGLVICGNPSRALRSRKKPTFGDADEIREKEKARLFAEKRYNVNSSYENLADDNPHLEDIVQELKEWRVSHEKRMKQIKESKVAQVLVIDDSTKIPLSDSEDDEDQYTALFSGQNYSADQTVNKNINDYNSSKVKRKGFTGKHDESFELEDEDIPRKCSPDRLEGAASKPLVYSRHRVNYRSSNNNEAEIVKTSTGLPMPIIKNISSPAEIPFPLTRAATSHAAFGFSRSPHIRRQLPEVPSLPSRPPIKKS